MRTKVIALAVCALVAAAAPASGAENREFIATANGTALKLTITEPGGEPQGVTVGASSALVQSSATKDCAGTACASSAAAVEPFGETADVVAKKTTKKDSAEGFVVPEGFEPILSGALGTATVTANPAPSPKADAEATAGSLEVNVLKTLLDPVQKELDGAVDQITDGLEPILGPVESGDPTGLTTEVRKLVDALIPALADNPVAVAEVGASGATAADSGKTGVTTATAVAEGADVKLAPVPTLAPNGVFHVKVGDATATVTSDGEKATKSSKGSIVKLFVVDLSTAKAGDYREVDVATDQPEQCFGQSPLVICIIAGGTAEEGEGPQAGATAAAVRIRAFADADDPGANNPLRGLTLAVAEAVAGVNAAIDEPAVTVLERPEPEPDPEERELPSTGGGLIPLGLAVLGTGAFFVARLRRRD